MIRSILPVLALISLLASGCREERYFGPYELSVPTNLKEDAAGRTFEFPLDDRDREELDELARCLEEEPEREVPCICDFPVLTASEQDLRLDYRLVNPGTESVNVMVWVGREVGPRDPPPEILPDLPLVEVLVEHHHQVRAGGSFDDIFLEDEMTAVKLAVAMELHSECPQDAGDLPVPLSILYGLSIEPAYDEILISAEFTFRVQEND